MTVLKWVLIIVLGVIVYRCTTVVNNATEYAASSPVATSGHPAPSSAPTYSLVIESFTCEDRGKYTEPKITVRNDGAVPIPYAKVFFRVGEAIEDTYTSPSTIPPGSLASASALIPHAGDCSIVGIQDRRGANVPYRELP